MLVFVTSSVLPLSGIRSHDSLQCEYKRQHNLEISLTKSHWIKIKSYLYYFQTTTPVS